MKLLLKLFVSASLAVILGAVSADFALWLETQHGEASATSDNPYARAAYVVHDFLPDETPAEAHP